MNPISFVIDQVEKLLGHSPHPAVVAIPLGAWTVSNIADGLALATGESTYDDVARVSMAIGLAGAAGAVVTGLHDYSKIPKERPSHEVATTHGLGNALAVSLVTASFVMRVRDADRSRRTGVPARLIALTGGAISLYTAYLGGKLIEEMGESVKPMEDRLLAQDRASTARETGRGRLEPASPLGIHNA